MGLSWSTRRRTNHHYLQHPPPFSSYYYSIEPPCPLPPHPQNPFFNTAIPYPPAPVQPYYHHSGAYYSCNYANPVVSLSNYYPYYENPVTVTSSLPAAPPYVEHRDAKKVRNDVNVHKDTVRVSVDEGNPDELLVSFVFDALFDGSITIFYIAKEETNCTFVPLFPQAYMPVRIPFQKGIGQKFQQPSGTGIDLGFFELVNLSKPSLGEDVLPLVISAETSHFRDEYCGHPMPNKPPRKQITQAMFETKNGNPFQVKVIRQILWIDGVCYELREIYGFGSATEGFNDNDSGKQCVICMIEPKDTAALPCRHMCMCSECAKELRHQSDKCPVCRHPIEELIEIKMDTSE